MKSDLEKPGHNGLLWADKSGDVRFVIASGSTLDPSGNRESVDLAASRLASPSIAVGDLGRASY